MCNSDSFTSTVLFEHLCIDLGLSPEPEGSRFDPFPHGIPTESELSISDFARYALLQSAFKKSEVEESPCAETDTFGDFEAANNSCADFDAKSLSIFNGDPAVGLVLTSARERLYQVLNCEGMPVVTMGSIESAARFGPGRSVGLGKKPQHLYFKVGDSIQTAGSEFIRSWYELSVNHNPVCQAAEMARKARHGVARVGVLGNLAFVPKSFSKKRIVITEPSLNTYFQLGLGSVFEGVLRKHFHIDFSNQPAKNAELAREGSITGNLATADLKQCSDYISLGLVEYLFPPSAVRWMKILRTPVVQKVEKHTQPNGSTFTVKSEIVLNMCSTMGNGFTFPMQTLLLSSLVESCLSVLDVTDNRWGVFGDDIVLPTLAFPLLCKVLAACGLKVNDQKSFASGFFRESCGSDWFHGVNVRGVYLKRYCTDQDLISCYNRLALWSAKHDISLEGTLKCILQVISVPVPLVPPDEPVTAGIRIPMPVTEPDHQGLWTYYPWQAKTSSFHTEPWLCYEMGESIAGKPRRFARWVKDLEQFCDGSFNEPALLKVLLAGGIRRYAMTFRQDAQVAYHQRRRITPRWGFTCEEGFPSEGEVDCFLRLQLLIEATLLSFLV